MPPIPRTPEINAPCLDVTQDRVEVGGAAGEIGGRGGELVEGSGDGRRGFVDAGGVIVAAHEHAAADRDIAVNVCSAVCFDDILITAHCIAADGRLLCVDVNAATAIGDVGHIVP